MRRFKVTYIFPGNSTWLYIEVTAPSTYAARQIAEAELTGVRILNVTPLN
jgi:hypothetical protein